MPAEHAGKLANFKALFERHGEVFKKHIPARESVYDEVAKDLTAGTNGCPDEGLRYMELPVEQRIIVMQLAQQRGIDESLDEIDSSLREVRDWFKHSKPYYP